MSNEITLIVKIEVKDGLRQKQIDAFNKISLIVLKEPGCLQYELKALEDKLNEFVILEKWDSLYSLHAHENSPHMIESDKNNVLFRSKKAEVIKLINI
ncbi:MAG: antibiotic biosynthesis monooxygenase [Campylobacterales bacterium]|nr:antibiotic biosynthesis monooxygenase [Campylobacterales bacterium]